MARRERIFNEAQLTITSSRKKIKILQKTRDNTRVELRSTMHASVFRRTNKNRISRECALAKKEKERGAGVAGVK